MQPAQHPARIHPGRLGARDVRPQRIAHRQHAPGAQHHEHGRVDQRVGLAQRPHVAAHRRVALRQRAGAQHAHAAADDLQVRVGADHRQAAVRAVLQHRVPGLGRVLGAMVVGAGVQHAGGAGRRVQHRQRQAGQHVAVALRPQMEHLVAQRPRPGVAPVAQHLMRGLAGAHHPVIQLGAHAHARQLPADGVRAAGRVGQQDDALAGLAQGHQAVAGAGVGRHAVMHDAPQVQDQPVIPVRQRRQARKVPHAAVPRAWSTVVNPCSRMAASSSRFIRATSAGPE